MRRMIPEDETLSRTRQSFVSDFSCAPRRSEGSDKLARIQDALRVQRVFDRPMEGADRRRRGVGPPAFFRQANAVFAGDDAAPGEHAPEQIVQSRFAAFPGAGLRL